MKPQPTGRIRFQALKVDDAELLNRLNNAPGVMTYLDHRPPALGTIIEKELPKLLRVARDHPGFGMWLAYLHETVACIGWFSLQPNRPNSGDAEIGYRLFPDFWRQGFASEGAQELLRYAFEHLGVQRCVANTMAVNMGSRKVMERIGLKHTRTYHLEFEHPLPGTEEGEVEYALTREEWLLRRP